MRHVGFVPDLRRAALIGLINWLDAQQFVQPRLDCLQPLERIILGDVVIEDIVVVQFTHESGIGEIQRKRCSVKEDARLEFQGIDRDWRKIRASVAAPAAQRDRQKCSTLLEKLLASLRERLPNVIQEASEGIRTGGAICAAARLNNCPLAGPGRRLPGILPVFGY